MKILGILTFIAWALYLACDYALLNEMERSMHRADGTYGEMYGPLSYFAETLKYGTFIMTMVLIVTSWRQSHSRK